MMSVFGHKSGCRRGSADMLLGMGQDQSQRLTCLTLRVNSERSSANFRIGPEEDERQTFNVCSLQPCSG